MNGARQAAAGAMATGPVQGVLQLAGAQALAVLAAAGAAVLYARWLQPAQLAGWLLAMAVSRAGLLLLDGGLKTSLVRAAALPDAHTLQRLQRQAAWLAAALSLAVAAAAATLAAGGRLGPDAAWLLALCPLACFAAQPPLPVALARLERAGCFGPVGRAEGASLLLEFTLPALLMAGGLGVVPAFVGATTLARVWRTARLLAAARQLPAPRWSGQPLSTAAAWRDGASVQAVAALSMLRDNAHLWLLGPWHGAAWAGRHGLALTACTLASQVAVTTAARVALPRLRDCTPAQRWPLLLRQTRLLAMACLPPLALLPAWLAWADARLWSGQWAAALPLLPWLLLRMVAGVGLTTLGAGLLLAPGAWTAARCHARWTLLELALAVAALAMLGPAGLAIAGVPGAWLGLLLFLRGATPAGTPWGPRLAPLLAAMLARPSLALALGLAAWVQRQPDALAAATLALPLCWLAEPVLWRRVAARRRPSAMQVVRP
jgi:hypothetical protein